MGQAGVNKHQLTLMTQAVDWSAIIFSIFCDQLVYVIAVESQTPTNTNRSVIITNTSWQFWKKVSAWLEMTASQPYF